METLLKEAREACEGPPWSRQAQRAGAKSIPRATKAAAAMYSMKTAVLHWRA